MSKRTLDAFFKPTTTESTKQAKPNPDNDTPPRDENEDIGPPDTHPSYPIPIPQLPSHISISLTHGTPAKEARAINNQPDLDLLYFQPYITRPTANELFKFLRRELPFYRVQYTIKRGGIDTDITTPRYTTVFGVDDTAQWASNPSTQQSEADEEISLPDNATTPTNPPSNNQQSTPPTPFCNLTLIETTSKQPIRTTKYQYTPRPIPTCLAHLKTLIECTTGSRYNFCLVNYYSSGNDSISFHSDDERFLGSNPDIASLSLGGEREFHMKHRQAGTLATRPITPVKVPKAAPVKFSLSSGDMIVMRGSTQTNWLHSIPKRKGDAVRGRINITFRRAMVPGGTNNYYRYNVGCGAVWRWDESRQEMVCTGEGGDGDEMRV